MLNWATSSNPLLFTTSSATRFAATQQKLAGEIQQTPSSATNHSLMYVELGLFYWVLEC
jgi:hypothetical protein